MEFVLLLKMELSKGTIYYFLPYFLCVNWNFSWTPVCDCNRVWGSSPLLSSPLLLLHMTMRFLLFSSSLTALSELMYCHLSCHMSNVTRHTKPSHCNVLLFIQLKSDLLRKKVKYCYWEVLNQTIQYYPVIQNFSLRLPAIYLIWDY